jgi:hypothetical protein
LAWWKWCLSFRKIDWDLGDYPIVVRKQDTGDLEPSSSRLKLVPCSAAVVNWWALQGGGDMEEGALADLRKNFENHKLRRLERGDSLPRPGTYVPIEFASRERVEAHRELADDFISRVLEIDWALITDESSLWDFNGEETNKDLIEKIK